MKISAGAVIGTTLMTAFSFARSRSAREQFREPQLLNILLRRLPGVDYKSKNNVIGWASHYGVGFLFVLLYRYYWKRHSPSVASGVMLGALSGALGIATWKTLFRNHPLPPHIDYKKYYQQLFAAHLIFGAGAAIGYRSTFNNENKYTKDDRSKEICSQKTNAEVVRESE